MNRMMTRTERWCLIPGMLLLLLCGSQVEAQKVTPADPAENDGRMEKEFEEQVRPRLAKYCIRCHNEEITKSGVRLDRLTGNPDNRQLFTLKNVLKQIVGESMPPDEEPQP